VVNQTIRQALDEVSLASLSGAIGHPREGGDRARMSAKASEFPAFAGMTK
jgi:hypothetical protein